MKSPIRAFVGGELDPSLHERVDISQYQYGLRECYNYVVRPQGGAENRPGFRFVTEVKDSTKAVRLIPFQFNSEQTYILEFGNLYVRFIQDGAYLESAPSTPVEVTTTYTESELFDIQFVQTADTMTLTHRSHKPAALVRTGALTWTLTDIDFGTSVAQIPTPITLTPKNTTISAGGYTYKYLVTSTNGFGVESLPSAEATIETLAEISKSGNIAIEISWPPVSGAEYYTVYKDTGTGNLVYGFIGFSKDPAAGNPLFNDFAVSPDTAFTPPSDRKPFETDFPGVVGLYQQRQLYANTTLYPNSFFASQTGIYNSMRRSTPLRDTDSITFTIASRQIDEIRHIIDLEQLIIMTAGAVYPVSEGSEFVLTPSSIGARARTFVGVSKVKPISAIDSVVYVTEKSNRLRDMLNNKDQPGDGGVDLTLLAYHLVEGKEVIEMTYAHHPAGVVWVVMDDGKLLGMTYNKQQGIWAWHQHETLGTFESITSIIESNRDAVYVVVKRSINGVDKRYIERLEPHNDTESESAFFVDSGYTYIGVSTSTISGLDHLEGEIVSILADGNVVKDLVVTSGVITLPRAATTVHVGLPYQSRIRTLPLNDGSEQFYASVKNISEVHVSFHKSRGGFAGVDLNDLQEIRPRYVSDGYGTIQSKTYKANISITPKWDDNGSVYLVQNDPLPSTILAITPEFDVSE